MTSPSPSSSEKSPVVESKTASIAKRALVGNLQYVLSRSIKTLTEEETATQAKDALKKDKKELKQIHPTKEDYSHMLERLSLMAVDLFHDQTDESTAEERENIIEQLSILYEEISDCIEDGHDIKSNEKCGCLRRCLSNKCDFDIDSDGLAETLESVSSVLSVVTSLVALF